MTLAIVTGVPLGLYAGLDPGSRPSRIIMGSTILVGVLTILFSLVVDILYAWFDPRVRHGVTPVAPADPALPSCRDVLVLTWKRGGVPGQPG